MNETGEAIVISVGIVSVCAALVLIAFALTGCEKERQKAMHSQPVTNFVICPHGK